jgi:hypothetical protein
MQIIHPTLQPFSSVVYVFMLLWGCWQQLCWGVAGGAAARPKHALVAMQVWHE